MGHNMGWSAASEPITLFARWAFFSEKKNHIGWSGGGRMTLNARWTFFTKHKHNIGWSGACGRMTLNARWAFFIEQKQVIFDGVEHVDG